jgi:adenylate cyclase
MAATRGPLIALVMIAACLLGLFDTLNLKTVDSLFALRGPRAATSPILIVSIGEDSFDEVDLAWPWPRALQAQLLDRIAAGQPVAIGVDVAFPEPSSRGPEDDAVLAEAIGRANNVVLAAALTTFEQATYTKEDLNPPIPVLRDRAAGYGPVNFLLDPDAFVRTGETHHLFQEQELPSFVSLLYGLAVKAGVSARTIDQREFLINFRGGPGSFPIIPAYQILRGDALPEVFHGQVVIIGATSPVLHDMYPTPFAPHGDMPGAEIHANALETLLQGISIRRVPGWVEMVFILAAGVIGVWITSQCKPMIALSYLTAAAVGFFITAFWLFASERIAVDVVPVSISLLMSYGATVVENFILEQRQRGMLMQLFSKHVSPEIAGMIWTQREAFLSGGRLRSQKLYTTVLFSDLKGFTTISERMETQALLDWINDYMEVMAKLVAQHGGIVNDYFGDAIMANFGVPFPRTTEQERAQDACRAVDCALAMGKELQRLNGLWQEKGLPTVGLRIGICSGEVTAGCVGSSERLKYTTIGDVVNTASRLESYEKDLEAPDLRHSPSRTLIGESTQLLVKDRFWVQQAGSLQLKGKARPLSVFRVYGTKQDGVRQRADLRKATRVQLENRVVVFGSARTNGLIGNVSAGGLSISKLPHQSPIGDVAQLQFELPGCATALRTTGTVVWANHDRAGFSFRDLTPSDRQLVEKFIQEQSGSQPVPIPSST